MARQARVWTADALDRSSNAVQGTLAPKLSSALSATASRVRPAIPKRRLLRGVLRALGLLGVAGIASAAAAFAVRNRTAIRDKAAAHLPGFASTAPHGTDASNGHGTNSQSSAGAPTPNAEAGADAGR
jgi:hypothetical protein